MPVAVRRRAEKLLGAPVESATRVEGRYAPSVTFRLRLADGSRAFLRGAPPSASSRLLRSIAREGRVYHEAAAAIAPFAPALRGAFHLAGWRVLLLEDLGGPDVPPWTASHVATAAPPMLGSCKRGTSCLERSCAHSNQMTRSDPGMPGRLTPARHTP
jgi:hypothetical protein